jgi:multicomponent Na+:H+ antiporter subunit C
METALALAIGVLFASGTYMMLQRSAMRLFIGLVLLGHAVNLLLFSMGGLTRTPPPIVPAGAPALPEDAADPLPQALILTAIVIGFGLQAFTLMLIHRMVRAIGKDDVDELRSTDTVG